MIHRNHRKTRFNLFYADKSKIQCHLMANEKVPTTPRRVFHFLLCGFLLQINGFCACLFFIHIISMNVLTLVISLDLLDEKKYWERNGIFVFFLLFFIFEIQIFLCFVVVRFHVLHKWGFSCHKRSISFLLFDFYF